jgi:phage shock protein C
MSAQPEGPSRPTKRLVRRRQDRMVGGVCAGVAAYLGVDVTLVRVLTVLGTVFGFGSVLVVYLVLWAVLPLE